MLPAVELLLLGWWSDPWELGVEVGVGGVITERGGGWAW